MSAAAGGTALPTGRKFQGLKLRRKLLNRVSLKEIKRKARKKGKNTLSKQILKSTDLEKAPKKKEPTKKILWIKREKIRMTGRNSDNSKYKKKKSSWTYRRIEL